MDYLPVFLRIRGRGVLVVGGGEVALRKVRWVLKAGAQVTVVAPELHPELLEHVLRDGVRHAAAHFTPELLREVVAVIAATDTPQVNAPVAAAAQARALPVNVVDDAELSTFIFPAIIDRSPLIVAVSSAGQAPVLARRVREQIEALLPERLGALARFMGARRHRAACARASRAPALLGAAGRRTGGDPRCSAAPTTRRAARSSASCSPHASSAAQGGPPGEVYLIGAGPGDPDLLTLRALQLLQQADVILYDRLVSPGVLERARRDAQRIFVGKAAGDPGQQERIHRLMVSLAGQGKRVARLKGGDPFVFGRGGEEIEVLAAHGIPCQVVPGITAALGAAAAAAVPLTHRRLAQSVTLVTGHVSEKPSADWRYFADPCHTVVFYMGVAQLPSIIARLRAAGAAAEHPAAIIERATWPEQRMLRGTLADIARLAGEQRAEPPALLIVGAVAALGRRTRSRRWPSTAPPPERWRERRRRLRRRDRQHAAHPPEGRERGDRLRDPRQGGVHEPGRLGQGPRRACHRCRAPRSAASSPPAASWSRAPPATPASGSRTCATRAATAASSSCPTTSRRRSTACWRCSAPRCSSVPAVPYSNPNQYQKVAQRLAASPAATRSGRTSSTTPPTATRTSHTTGPEIWDADRRASRRLRRRERHRRHVRRGRGVPEVASRGGPLRARRSAGQQPVRVRRAPARSRRPAAARSPRASASARITANLKDAPIDDAVHVEDADTVRYVYRLLREEGLFLGSTSGINVAAAVRVARELGPGHTIVTVLCDGGAKYQSRLFNRAWLEEKGLAACAAESAPPPNLALRAALVA